ncbi:hypothetical protein [Treponema sp. R8-4-B8]
MKDKFGHKFEIKRVFKETDSGYHQAIRIYNETTPVEIKTNTNEIVHWLNKEGHFKIMVFVLYLDEEVIGFSMIGYVVGKKIVIIDYLALKPQYRINSAFFSYIGLLQDYLRESDIEVSYYITEISNKGEGKNIDKESKIFKKLICLEGFGRINSIYHTPPLGLTNYESEFESFLYIKTSDSIKRINRDTYLDIIQAIYYDYYYEWYKDLLSSNPQNLDKYKQKIDNCFDFVKKNIVDNSSCEIIYGECPFINGPNIDEKTYGHLPVSKKDKSKRMLLFLIPLLLAAPVGIIWVYNFILTVLAIQFDSVSTIIGGYFAAVITALSTYLITKNKS